MCGRRGGRGDDRSLNRVQCGFLDPQDEETLLENYYFFKKSRGFISRGSHRKKEGGGGIESVIFQSYIFLNNNTF